MNRKRISGLYAITPDLYSDIECLLRRVEDCLEGGVQVVQYRNKTRNAPHQQIALTLAAICRRHGAALIVNDDVDLAIQANADGVHLGREDGNINAARSKLGPGSIIGVSCYGSLEMALEAERAGADYVAFGSLFASPTKPQAPHAPLSLLAEAKARLNIPIVAIGGITLQNASQAISAGADAVAVISAVFEAPDVKLAAQDFSNLFK